MPKSKTTKSTKVATIENTAGALLWWDFDSVLVSPSTMLATLAKHGLDGEITVPTIDASSAIKSTANGFTAGRGCPDKVRAKVVGQYDDGSVEIAILQDFVKKGEKNLTKGGSADKAGATQIDTVVFDTNSDSWLYSGTTDHAQRFIEKADQRRSFLGHDFVRRQVVHRPLEALGAFPLRRRMGGFYFIPSGNLEKAERIAACVNDLPSDCFVSVAHVNASAASQQAIGRSARDYIETGLGSLKQRLAAWKESSRSPRSDALQNALSQFSQLADHARLYRDALNLELGDLTKEMEEAKALALEMAGAQTLTLNSATAKRIKAYYQTLSSEDGIALAAWSDLGSAGLSDDKAWWDARSAMVAKTCEIAIEVREDGVAFPVAKPDPEPETVVVEDVQSSDIEDHIASMDIDRLTAAIEAVTGKRPTTTEPDALRAAYRDALGL